MKRGIDAMALTVLALAVSPAGLGDGGIGAGQPPQCNQFPDLATRTPQNKANAVAGGDEEQDRPQGALRADERLRDRRSAA